MAFQFGRLLVCSGSGRHPAVFLENEFPDFINDLCVAWHVSILAAVHGSPQILKESHARRTILQMLFHATAAEIVEAAIQIF